MRKLPLLTEIFAGARLSFLITFLFLVQFKFCQRIDGQFFTPGLLIINGPSPNSEKEAGKNMAISLEITGDGILPPSNTDAGSELATAILSVEIYLINQDMNMTVSQGPRLLQGERGSSVKHMNFKIPQCVPSGEYQLTFHELDRINKQAFYSIYSIPIVVKNKQGPGSQSVIEDDIEGDECGQAPKPQAELKDSRPSKQPFTSKGVTGFKIQNGRTPASADNDVFVPEVQPTTFAVNVAAAPIPVTAIRIPDPAPSALGASIPDPVSGPEPQPKPASPVAEIKLPSSTEVKLLPPTETKQPVPAEVKPPPPIEVKPLPLTQTKPPITSPELQPGPETRIPIPPPEVKLVPPPPSAPPLPIAPEAKKDALNPLVDKIPAPSSTSSQSKIPLLNSNVSNITPGSSTDGSNTQINGAPSTPNTLKPAAQGSNTGKSQPRETTNEALASGQMQISSIDLKLSFRNQSQPARNSSPNRKDSHFLREVADLSIVNEALAMPESNSSEDTTQNNDSSGLKAKSTGGIGEIRPGPEHMSQPKSQLVFSVPLISSSIGTFNQPVLISWMGYIYFSLALVCI